jgi:hypothetical protein
MPKGALFVGWGTAVRGREQQALQVFQEAMEFNQRLQQQGEIDSFEAVQLEPHGGDLAGFVLMKGDVDKLARVRTNPEFVRLTTRAQLVVDNLGVTGAFLGEELQRLFEDLGQQAAALR